MSEPLLGDDLDPILQRLADAVIVMTVSAEGKVDLTRHPTVSPADAISCLRGMADHIEQEAAG